MIFSPLAASKMGFWNKRTKELRFCLAVKNRPLGLPAP